MKYLFKLVLLLLSANSIAQNVIEEEEWLKVKNQNFDSLLTALNIELFLPENFSEVDVVKNNRILYNKAFKHDSSKFEVRILIHDLKKRIVPEGLSNDALSRSITTMLSLNASNYVLPNIPEITVFDSTLAHVDYNADWCAGSAFLTFTNEFNTGFEVCSIIGIRKDEVAEVYMFFMISDRDKETYLIQDASQIVRFK